MDIHENLVNRLMEAGIFVDDYAKAADQIQDFDFHQTKDPVEDFKRMIILLNQMKKLHPSLAEYAGRYGEHYNEPEIYPEDLDGDY